MHYNIISKLRKKNVFMLVRSTWPQAMDNWVAIGKVWVFMDSAADTGTSVSSSLCRSEVNNSKSYLTLVGEVWNAGNML